MQGSDVSPPRKIVVIFLAMNNEHIFSSYRTVHGSHAGTWLMYEVVRRIISIIVY